MFFIIQFLLYFIMNFLIHFLILAIATQNFVTIILINCLNSIINFINHLLQINIFQSVLYFLLNFKIYLDLYLNTINLIILISSIFLM